MRNPWLHTVVPDRVANIPAFLSGEEKQYLLWLTEQTFAGWGAILDLGAWLGGSSACMAEGLKRRRRSEKIQSFDLFSWEPDTMQAASGEVLPAGADFRPVLERHVRDHRAWIEPRKADLFGFHWNEGPIEILFVDAAKSWELTNAIFAGFGDSVVPGKTRVVFQDYRFHITYWLPLIVESRPDLWQEVEAVDDGNTVTFVTRKPLLGPGGLRTDYADAHFPLEASERILRQRMQRENPANRALLLQALYRKTLMELPAERARAVRDEVFAAAGGSPPPEVIASIEDVAWPVSASAWQAYERGEVALARGLAEDNIARRGELPHSLHLLGRICLESGELQLAEDYLNRAISADLSSSLFALTQRAELRRRAGKHDEAVKDVILFLEHSSGNEAAVEHGVWQLEKIWDSEGRSDRGRAVLADLAKKNGRSAVLWGELGRVEAALGRRAEALAHVEHATSLAPAHPFVLRCRRDLGLEAPPQR